MDDFDTKLEIFGDKLLAKFKNAFYKDQRQETQAETKVLSKEDYHEEHSIQKILDSSDLEAFE